MKQIAYCLALIPLCSVAFAQQPIDSDSNPIAWTREAAIRQLQQNPHDAYLQFVAIQLSQNRWKCEYGEKEDYLFWTC